MSYDNVTVQGAAKSAGKDAATGRKAVMAAIEKEETAKTGLIAEVVTLCNGRIWLLPGSNTTDVQLVFTA